MSSKLELLKAANRHYPDGQLASYFDEETGEPVEPAKGEGGDTLAQFIVVELSEAADTPQEAVRLMERAQDDIREAIIGLLELTE